MSDEYRRSGESDFNYELRIAIQRGEKSSSGSGDSGSSSSSSSSSPPPSSKISAELSQYAKELLRASDNGRKLLDNKDFDGAIEAFTKAINIEPCPGDYYHRGLCYRHKKEHDRAIADFNNALSSQNANGFDYSEVYHSRGMSYMALEEDKKAIADFTKALDLGIKHSVPDIYYFRGMSYFYMQNLQLAANDWRKAVSLAKSNEQAHISAKKMLNENASEIAEYEEMAKGAFEGQLSKANNGDVSACFNVGKSYEEGFGVSQDLNEAIKWYKKAATKGNDNAKEKVKEIEERIKRK